jgi:hypothetical protein
MPACSPGDFQPVAQRTPQAIQQCIPPFVVERSHPPDVPREVILDNEISQHCLTESRGGDIHCHANGLKPVDQRSWNDDISQAKRGIQHLAESSDVHDARVAVEALQRGDRHVFVSVFAVVIEFENPGSRAFGLIQQLQPA